MKKTSAYLTSLILTLLLIFVSIGACASCVLCSYALNPRTAMKIVSKERIASRVQSSLETEFRQRESTTGIPASLYAASISEDAVKPIIEATITNGFAYLRGDVAKLEVSPDFSSLEHDIRNFFEKYAKQNDIPRNDSYELAVRETINSAETEILTACDVFRFQTLDNAGIFQKVKPYLPWAKAGAAGLIAASILLMLILALVNFHRTEFGLYWSGIALIIASILILIPSVWLEKARWFDRFAVKTDQTFAAVTGFLYAHTHLAITIALIGIAIGAVMLALFGILRYRKHRA